MRSFSLWRNILGLLSYTAVGQLVSIISLPIITVYFSPSEFGEVAYFIAVVSILGTIATGKFDQAILKIECITDAWRFIFIIIIISSSISICTLLYSLSDLEEKWRILTKNDLSYVYIILPVSIFSYSLSQGMVSILTRQGKYRLIGLSILLRDVNYSLIRILLGIFYKFSSALIFSFLFAQITYLITISAKQVKTARRVNVDLFNWYKIKRQILDYKRFPLVLLPTELLNLSTQNLPILLLGYFFEPKVLGLYALCRSLLGLPSMFLGKSIAVVFQKEATDLFHNTGSCTKLYSEIIIKILIAGMGSFVLFWFVGEHVILLAFGDSWKELYEYCIIFYSAYLLRLAVKPVSYIYILSDNLVLDLFMSQLGPIMILASIFIGYYYSSDKMALILVSASISINYILYGIIGYSLTNNKGYSGG